MPNKCFSIKDDSFSNGILSNHQLSVRISGGTLENAVFDVTRNMIVAYETWALNNNEDFSNFKDSFDKITNDSFVLGWEFKKVMVIIDTKIYTLIPDKLFVADEARQYLELNHSSTTNETICVDNIEIISSKNIYQVPCGVEKVCRQTFPNFSFCNTCSILIGSFLKINPPQETVMVNFSGKRIDILVSGNGMLKFCNSFTFTTAQDIIYYILNVYKKLGLDTSSTPVMLAGEITTESAAYEIIYRYIRNIYFAQRPVNIKFCEDLADVPAQMCFDLFNSFL